DRRERRRFVRRQAAGVLLRLVEARAVVDREGRIGIERVAVEIAKHAAVELVGSAVGHNVHHAAAVAAALGVGARRDHAELLHRVVHLEGNRLVAAARHVVGAVEQEVVRRGPVAGNGEGRARQRRSAFHVVRVGREQAEREEVAVEQRQRAQLVARNHAADLRAQRLVGNGGRLGFGHFLAAGRGRGGDLLAQRREQVFFFAHRDGQARARVNLFRAAEGAHLVALRRRHLGDVVDAVVAGYRRALKVQRRVFQHHVDARQRFAGRVIHRAGNDGVLAGGKAERRGGNKQQNGCEQAHPRAHGDLLKFPGVRSKSAVQRQKSAGSSFRSEPDLCAKPEPRNPKLRSFGGAPDLSPLSSSVRKRYHFHPTLSTVNCMSAQGIATLFTSGKWLETGGIKG